MDIITKKMILKHISNQQYPGSYFYEPYRKLTKYNNITYEDNALTDFRVNNELVSLNEYLSCFDKDISNIHATLDKPLAMTFKTSQPNVDFIVKLDHMFGLRKAITYQDDKSGMDMFKHSTKGSIGVVYYDQNGNNIQMTSNPIEMSNLLLYNQHRIKMIEETLMNEGIYENFKGTLKNAHNICTKMETEKFDVFCASHYELQTLLWKEIQCHSTFQSSLSFVFLKQVINEPLTPKEHAFSKTFQSQLQADKLYNLNKKGDMQEFYRAFIYAGKEIDPQFINKLQHLHNNGLTLTMDILNILSKLVKEGLT